MFNKPSRNYVEEYRICLLISRRLQITHAIIYNL
jgi:hypothetical protein